MAAKTIGTIAIGSPDCHDALVGETVRGAPLPNASTRLRIRTRRMFLYLIGRCDLAEERYRTRMQLLDLTDHQLRDIGITRDEARAEARKGMWR